MLSSTGVFSLQSNWIPTVVALANLAINAALDVAFAGFGSGASPLSTSIVTSPGTVALLYCCGDESFPRRETRAGLDPRIVCARPCSPRSRLHLARLDHVLGRSFPAQLLSLGSAPWSSGRLPTASRLLRCRSSKPLLSCEPECGAVSRLRREAYPMDPEQDPQLLDHRPHRPRQVDAGRSHPRADHAVSKREMREQVSIR